MNNRIFGVKQHILHVNSHACSISFLGESLSCEDLKARGNSKRKNMFPARFEPATHNVQSLNLRPHGHADR